MKRFGILLFCSCLILFGRHSFAKPPIKSSPINSIYTALSEDKCKTIELDEESSYSIQLCPGIEGYKLKVEEADLRQSISVITPNGKEHPLEFWRVVTTRFSTVGEKAEWRVLQKGKKVVPIALIVRVTSNKEDDPDNPRRISRLVVSKLSPSQICVTDVIEQEMNQNEKARVAADSAIDRPCREVESIGE